MQSSKTYDEDTSDSEELPNHTVILCGFVFSDKKKKKMI